jgi:hypothetical protein
LKIHFGVGSLIALAAVASLAGCGMGPSTSSLPSAGQSGLAPMSRSASQFQGGSAFPDATPPKCKKQQTASDHATVKETFSTKGGTLCIPAFAGLGGSLMYPPANPSVGVTLTDSTTNYNGKLPSLHTGNPIFYLQLAIAGATSFGSDAPAGGGLTGATIKAGHAYTAYAQAVIEGFPINFTPCYTVATKGTYGGVIGGLGTLIKGQTLPAAASGVIEIYSGKSATGKC